MSRLTTYLAACAVFCCATTASAGVLNGYSGALISGSTPYQGFSDYPFNTPGNETALTGYIDWAVFAPDTFPAGFSGSYTPAAGEYVYTYQVFETGDLPLSFLGVTLENIANNVGFFDDGLGGPLDGVAPVLMQLLTSQANWSFASEEDGGNGEVQTGQYSKGLAFTSPYAPTMLDGVVQDGGSSGSVVPLPSPGLPVPEPGTLVFWSCGIIFGTVRWLGRRGRKVGYLPHPVDLSR